MSATGASFVKKAELAEESLPVVVMAPVMVVPPVMVVAPPPVMMVAACVVMVPVMMMLRLGGHDDLSRRILHCSCPTNWSCNRCRSSEGQKTSRSED